MPRAGWCRECGAWVWVTGNGGCPQGHAPDSVSHHYDSEPRAVVEIAEPFGEGPMPALVQRFNWGAFLIPALWGVAYGTWTLVALWAIALLVPLVLSVMAGMTNGIAGVSASTAVGVTVASDALIAFIRLWSGANANRLYWQRESRRMDADPHARPRIGVGRFLKRQQLWVLWGAVGALLASALMLPSAIELWKPFGLGWAAVAEPAVFFGAQIVLGGWLAHRMRVENPDTPIPAEGVV